MNKSNHSDSVLKDKVEQFWLSHMGAVKDLPIKHTQNQNSVPRITEGRTYQKTQRLLHPTKGGTSAQGTWPTLTLGLAGAHF